MTVSITQRRRTTPGTHLQGGFLSGYETNRNLIGRKWIERANEMVRTDPFVRAGVEVIVQTAKSAKFEFTPGVDVNGKPTRLSKKIALVFNDMLRKMATPWEEQLGQMILYSTTGYRYLEEIHTTTRGPGGRLYTYLSHFADCEPLAHYRWLTSNGYTLDGVEQFEYTYGANRIANFKYNPVTSASRLLVLTHMKTGSNWEGDGGVLRPISVAYSNKVHAEKARGIGADRWASATPYAEVDYDVLRSAGFGLSDIPGEIAKVETILSNYAVGASTSIVVPKGFTLRTFGGDFASAPTNDIIIRSNIEMLMGLMQPHLGMGSNDSSGSRAMSSLSSDIFLRWLINLLDYIVGRINGPARDGAGTVGRLMEINWPGTPREFWPTMVHTGINADAFEKLAGVVASWAANGLLGVPDMATAMLDRMGVRVTPELLTGLADAKLDPAFKNPGEAGTGAPSLEGGTDSEAGG